MDRGVETGLNGIDPAVIRCDLQHDLWIGAGELAQLRGEHGLGREPGTQQAHPANRLVLESRQRRERLANIRECRTEVREELLAGFSRRHTARRSRQEAQTDLLFKSAYRVAQP